MKRRGLTLIEMMVSLVMSGVLTVALMGARTVLAGLRPGVVSALVDLGADIDGIDAAMDVDDALRKA